MQKFMENKHIHRPEVMAPAGSMEAFKAAMEAGADAVYLGLPYFNARRPAKNFSADELKTAITAAHSQNVKVFITLNIDLKSAELPLLVRVLQLICDLQADAVIVKDWGVFYLIRKYYPQLEIHLSTQMGIANRLSAIRTGELGAARVVLARELSLEELVRFTGDGMPEIEIFAQGSMCFSFSGKCLLSSWVGGRSANRGGCLAPCRVPYSCSQQETAESCFSMKDLSLVKRLIELPDLPLSALKIEGRLKNPGWVKEMVSAYKQALSGGDVSKIELRLKQFSGRELTDGYLFTRSNLTAGQNLAYGVRAGKVLKAENGIITLDFTSKQPDTALRFYENGFAGMLYDAPETFSLDQDGHGVLPCTLPLTPGTLVYEVGVNENIACSSKIGQYGYDLKVKLTDQQTLCLTVVTDEGEEMQNIKIKQVKHADRGTQISCLPEKLQGKFYYGRALNKFTLETDFTLSRSQLNNLPEAVGQAMAKLQNRFQLKTIKLSKPEIQTELRSYSPDKSSNFKKYAINLLRVRAADLPQLLAEQIEVKADGLIVDLIELSDIENITLAAKKSVVTAALFPVLFENDLQIEQELITALYLAGVRNFEVNDLAHLGMLAAYPDCKLTSGSGLAAYNYLAAEYIGQMGVSSVMAPLELDMESLQDLGNLSKIPILLTVLTRVPLFYSRAENAAFQQGEKYTDQLGNSLEVVNYRGVHIFYSAEHFYAGTVLERNIRLKSVIADLGGEEDIAAKFAALQNGECPVEYRTFNLERKLY